MNPMMKMRNTKNDSGIKKDKNSKDTQNIIVNKDTKHDFKSYTTYFEGIFKASDDIYRSPSFL